jgi:uncharacterized protein (TIGR03083 family)
MSEQTIFSARLDILEQTWSVWADLGSGLCERQWTTPTRCTGWNVAAVFAHVSMFPLALGGPGPPVPDDSPGTLLTAVEIVRRFNQPHGIAHEMAETVADVAIADAAGHDREELVARFAVYGQRAVAGLRTIDPTTLVPWPASGGVVTLVEALRIVLMESVVHLLDVQRALKLEPEVPASALRETVQFLAEVAPAVEFIEAATGRSSQPPPLPVLR